MIKMSEELLQESKKACESVAEKVEKIEKDLSSLEVKMMVEEELGYGLDKDEIIVLALTFRHIDNLFDGKEDGPLSGSQMIYR